MHMLPGYGQPRNISEAIVDMIYPETKKDSDNNGISKIKVYGSIKYEKV